MLTICPCTCQFHSVVTPEPVAPKLFLMTTLDAGIMSLRPVPPATKTTWLKLAEVFSKLLGGTEDGRRAHLYLTQLATDSLPCEALAPLPWHASPPDVEVMPVAQNGPHECVLAVLCPSVPLRVVWRRRR